jgi:hypothetical protein
MGMIMSRFWQACPIRSLRDRRLFVTISRWNSLLFFTLSFLLTRLIDFAVLTAYCSVLAARCARRALFALYSFDFSVRPAYALYPLPHATS